MGKKMVNEHYHDLLDLENQFSVVIESSSSSTSSFYTPPSKSLPPPSSSSGGLRGLSYIEHSVSKFDTLAGVAIKYGVEVADIKKLNGLVTDHQMFARKTIHIPSPGRHPPSSVLSDAPDNDGPNSSEQTPARRRKSDLFESLKFGSSPLGNVSPAMSTLQGYYGLKPAVEKSHSDGLEMDMYLKGGSYYPEDGPFTKSVTPLNAPLSCNRKCKSVAYDLYAESILADQEQAKDNGSDKLIENLSRWRKSEVDLMSKAPEMLLKEDANSGGGFSALGSKGLALRPKAIGRDVSRPHSGGGFPAKLGDSARPNIFSGVRKSSSTPSLQDAENSTSSSSSWLNATWSLKPDLQALSSSSITKPLLDGIPLPIPITGKISKAAID